MLPRLWSSSGTLLGWIDALWVFLMVGSAWKIGSGGGLGGD